MKTIFYGLAGEGLGHASRTLAIIDNLTDVEVHLFTFGKAYEFIKNSNYPHVHLIDGIMFHYINGHVSYAHLAYRTTEFYFKGLRKNINFIREKYEELHPDLFISDFEPSVARAAKLCETPLISVDNQHRFAYVDLVDLPIFLRMYGWCCGFAAKSIVPNPNHTIISIFHYDLIRTQADNVTLTNGLFRNNITDQTVVNDLFMLVYVRKSINDIFLNAIKDLPSMEIKVYGASGDIKQWIQQNRPNISFHDIGPNFVNDLSKCWFLITTAGNQLISEARFLNKPCLVVPEPGQYEQSINAYYAEKLGIGEKCDANKLNQDVITEFLFSHQQINNTVPNGVHTVTEIIRRYLDAS